MKPFLRLSIAGLMGIVLVTSMGLTALRSGSPIWTSTMFLVTCAILALGVVGAACCEGPARIWWLGFTMFGWGYLILALWADEVFPRPPTKALADILRDHLDGPIYLKRGLGVFGPAEEVLAFERVVHSLGGLIAAPLGGILALLLFTVPSSRLVQTEADANPNPPPTTRRTRRWWRVVAILVGLAVPPMITFTALAGAKSDSVAWTGALVMLTWALLALAALGAAFNQGRRRARWFGATLFGIGYLILISANTHEESWPQVATNRLLNSLRPWLPSVARESPASVDATVTANARILKALDRPIPMRFAQETPLEDVLSYVEAATRGPNGRGIAIYVDPVGLQDAERTTTSPVSIAFEDVPLRTSLHLLLKQLGMTYYVGDGVLIITSTTVDPEDQRPAYRDAYLLIGQCLLALLAAGLGSLLAPLVANPGSAHGNVTA